MKKVCFCLKYIKETIAKNGIHRARVFKEIRKRKDYDEYSVQQNLQQK